MKKIELCNGIFSSRIGFGCAPILGAIDKKKAERAIRFSLDMGVNHFDLARSYGYGESEKLVGEILKGRRDKVILSSKFGIKANWKASLLRPLKPLVRKIKNAKSKSNIEASPNLKKEFKASDFLLKRTEISSKEMTKSLEESLRSLKTDYLDFFFIHEPDSSLEFLDEVILTSERLKKEGKIRAFGLSFYKHQKKLHTNYLDFFDILQFNNSPGDDDYSQIIEDRADVPNILFSPLSGGNSYISPSEKLQKLGKDFPQSIILCSMFNENHIKSNIDSLS
jgi:aryl-alcohol dehydrogenase-like predicted oxidoreductase